ncbi:hypothetical protein KPP03845_100119 [Streptomyces xanthophaeus]|nr:hypothetical protein KPP03845_100119 [Streptomyces xanthophaeus]
MLPVGSKSFLRECKGGHGPQARVGAGHSLLFLLPPHHERMHRTQITIHPPCPALLVLLEQKGICDAFSFARRQEL